MSSKLSVGIHQPNFLPWFGFFHKMYLSDVFILHDNIQYSKRTVLRRTYIRNINKQSEKEFIILPLKKCSDFTLIKDLEIDHGQNWISKSLNKIKNAYSKTSFFDAHYGLVESWFVEAKHFGNFSEYTSYIIQRINDYLEIESTLLKSSELEATGNANEYNLDLVKSVKGTIYNSGGGADQYQLVDEFRKNEIELRIIDSYDFISNNNYFQNDLPFLNGLSIMDMLFNIDKSGIKKLFKKYEISPVIGNKKNF